MWSHPYSASADGKQRQTHMSNFRRREHPPGPHSWDQLRTGPGWGRFRPAKVLEPPPPPRPASTAGSPASEDMPCGHRRSQCRTEGQVHFRGKALGAGASIPEGGPPRNTDRGSSFSLVGLRKVSLPADTSLASPANLGLKPGIPP